MLQRFIDAQANGIYEQALSEIQAGQKSSHWMWFIFPQLEGLGHSYTAQYYAIHDISMARAYLQNPLLRKRLLEISQAVYNLNAQDIGHVFGYPDVMKFQSSMTLFALAAPELPIFKSNLNRYFQGQKCSYTARLQK